MYDELKFLLFVSNRDRHKRPKFGICTLPSLKAFYLKVMFASVALWVETVLILHNFYVDKLCFVIIDPTGTSFIW
jgi:hypothetical protein